MIAFLTEWKARLLALIPLIGLLLEQLRPQWLVQILGPGSEGWVNVIMVVGLVLIHQFLDKREDV